MEAGPAVRLCLTPDFRITELNEAAQRLYGQSRAAMLGHNYLNLFSPGAERNTVADHLQRELAGHPSKGFENSVRTSDGAERALQWSVSRIVNDEGVPVGLIAVGLDISERRRAEQGVRRYAQIVQASNDFIAFVDSSYTCQAVNSTYLKAFIKSEAEVTGHAFSALIGDKLFDTELKFYVDRCLKGDRTHCELWLDTPRWGRRCLDIHLNPFRDDKGAITGAVVIGRDITERQRADQKLLQQQQQLRTLASELALAGQRERRRVALGLHDQVGQALAMVKLKLRTALNLPLPADARRALEESQALLNQSIQSTRSLTFQLSSAVLQELGLVAALQQLVEWFDGETDSTRFEFRSLGQEQVLSEAKSLMLYDMARELLFNAVKYAQAGTVGLVVESGLDRLQITIDDDGVGFDTACLNDGPGPEGGFGYFSIRERLAAFGGEFEMESCAGVGTHVMMAIPCDDSGPAAREP